MELEVNDRVQVKVGTFAGLEGSVTRVSEEGDALVVIDDGPTKPLARRSLRLVRAAAHIGVGSHVIRRAEPDGPIGVVCGRAALRAEVSWSGLTPRGIDVRAIELASARAGAIVRDPEPEAGPPPGRFVKCPECPTLTRREHLQAHVAVHRG